VQPTFTNVRPKLTRREGEVVYSKEEWMESRSEENVFYTNPNSYNLRKLHWKKFNGVKSILELTNSYDFSTKRNIGEIGGIPFVQVWALIEMSPKINFLLTDADGINLSKLNPYFRAHQSDFRNLGGSETNGLRTAEFDLHTDSLELFTDCDLIMMWGVDYALEDSDIIKLLEFCRDKDIEVLMSTMTPYSNLNRFFLWLTRNRIVRITLGKELVSHSLVGYYRTRKYFEYLAKSCGVTCKQVFRNRLYSTYIYKPQQNLNP
jgi:hypothetical protein